MQYSDVKIKRKNDERPRGGLVRTIRRFLYLLIVLAVGGFAADFYMYHSSLENPDNPAYLKLHGVDGTGIITGKTGRPGGYSCIQYDYEVVNAAGMVERYSGFEYMDEIAFVAMQIGDHVSITYAPPNPDHARLTYKVLQMPLPEFSPILALGLPGLALWAAVIRLIWLFNRFLNRFGREGTRSARKIYNYDN